MTTAVASEFLTEVDKAGRVAGMRVATLTRAVTSIDDTVGWARLNELGTAATITGQNRAAQAVVACAEGILQAAALGDANPGWLAAVATPGRLGSGRDMSDVLTITRQVVTNRVAGGADWATAIDSSARYLAGVASSEPHRIGRDGLLTIGRSDRRFAGWRRVAEPDACQWCLMLATRGAVYYSRTTADGRGRRYHLHCHCHVELLPADKAAATRDELSQDWGDAIADPARMQRAGAMTDPSKYQPRRVELPDQLAAVDSEVLDDLAREAAELGDDAAAARLADEADLRGWANYRVESRLEQAWAEGDYETAERMSAEIDRRERWAKSSTYRRRTYDDYDLEQADLRADDLGATASDVAAAQSYAVQAPTKRQVQALWEEELEVRVAEASQDIKGIFISDSLSREAARKGITERTLFTGDARTAYKYASEELVRWWDAHGGRQPLWQSMHKAGQPVANLESKRRIEDEARRLAEEITFTGRSGVAREQQLADRAKRQRAARRR